MQEDITALRAFLPTQPLPAPSASSQSLPPSLLALLTPLLRANPPWGDPSASVVTSRLELLQKENDELYELLKESNVAKLKEEVEMLRQTVGSMETALKGMSGCLGARRPLIILPAHRISRDHHEPVVRNRLLYLGIA